MSDGVVVCRTLPDRSTCSTAIHRDASICAWPELCEEFRRIVAWIAPLVPPSPRADPAHYAGRGEIGEVTKDPCVLERRVAAIQVNDRLEIMSVPDVGQRPHSVTLGCTRMRR